MNKYLEKIAVSRVVREAVQHPDIFPNLLLQKLKNIGAIRSESTYAKGISAYAKKKISDSKTLFFRTPRDFTKSKTLSRVQEPTTGVLVGTRSVVTPRLYSKGSLPSKYEKMMDRTMPDMSHGERHLAVALGFDHEAAEARSMFLHPDSLPAQTLDVNGRIQGRHHSLAVLGEESNTLRNVPYHKPKLMRELVRGATGESTVVSGITSKRYGVDHLSGKDLAKLREARYNSSSLESGVEGFSPIDTRLKY